MDSDELDETSGNLNMTTVAVRTKMTLPQMMGRWLASDDTVVPLDTVIPANSNAEEVARQNAAAFASSESNATVAAMNHLGRPLETMVYDVSEGAPADGTVKINDVITSVDGTDVTVAPRLHGHAADLLVRYGARRVVLLLDREPDGPALRRLLARGEALNGATDDLVVVVPAWRCLADPRALVEEILSAC